MTKTQENVL